MPTKKPAGQKDRNKGKTQTGEKDEAISKVREDDVQEYSPVVERGDL